AQLALDPRSLRLRHPRHPGAPTAVEVVLGRALEPGGARRHAASRRLQLAAAVLLVGVPPGQRLPLLAPALGVERVAAAVAAQATRRLLDLQHLVDGGVDQLTVV